MIKAIEFPDMQFATKEDLFAELKKHEKQIIEDKCAKVYNINGNTKQSVPLVFNEQFKSIDFAKDGYVYPIISTTRYLDSHKDVHFDGCFTKTVKEQQGKVHYCLDHELRRDSIIAWDKSVKMLIQKLDWNIVGKSYSGQTEALVFEIKEEDFVRKDVLEDIKNKVSDFENSIRMIYVKVSLGMDSNLKEHKENKEYYDTRINTIANNDKVKNYGYFWGVEELKIWKEGSLVVAGGSNDATSIYTIEPSSDTQNNKSAALSTDEMRQLFKKSLNI